MKTVYYNVPARSMLSVTLDEFVRDEAKRGGITRAAVIRQAVAALRDRRLAEEREARRHAEALHRRIEAEHDRISGGY